MTQLETLHIDLLFSATHTVAICGALKSTAVDKERSFTLVQLWYEYTEADYFPEGTGDTELEDDGKSPVFEAMQKAEQEMKRLVKQPSLHIWGN